MTAPARRRREKGSDARNMERAMSYLYCSMSLVANNCGTSVFGTSGHQTLDRISSDWGKENSEGNLAQDEGGDFDSQYKKSLEEHGIVIHKVKTIRWAC